MLGKCIHTRPDGLTCMWGLKVRPQLYAFLGCTSQESNKWRLLCVWYCTEAYAIKPPSVAMGRVEPSRQPQMHNEECLSAGLLLVSIYAAAENAEALPEP